MSCPSRRTSPARAAEGTSSCIRLRIRRKVDLPQPEGPIRAVMPEAGMVSDTRSRTWWSPNQAVMSRASRVAGPVPGAGFDAAYDDGAGCVVWVMSLLRFEGAREGWCWVEAGGRQLAARLRFRKAGQPLMVMT